MKTFAYLLGFLFVTIAYAQEESLNETFDFPKASGSYLTMSLLAPVAFETPRYRFGYVQPINEKWMVGFDVGYGSESITYKSINRIDSDDYSLVEFRVEVYYLLPVHRKNIHYVSLEFGYLNHNEKFFNDSFLEAENDFKVRYEQADYQRTRQAITLKYGTFFELWRQFGLNVYYGIGIRQRNNEYSNIFQNTQQQQNELSDVNEEDEFGFVNNYYRKEGTQLGLNLQLGVKLFYHFQ